MLLLSEKLERRQIRQNVTAEAASALTAVSAGADR